MMVVIGVLSSWDTFAVNSFLILSLSLFSVMSLINTTAPPLLLEYADSSMIFEHTSKDVSPSFPLKADSTTSFASGESKHARKGLLSSSFSFRRAVALLLKDRILPPLPNTTRPSERDETINSNSFLVLSLSSISSLTWFFCLAIFRRRGEISS